MSVNEICTPLKINSFKYEWTIEKFGLQVLIANNPVPHPGETPIVKSPSFFLDDKHIEWYLGWYRYIYPHDKWYGVGLWAEFQSEVQHPEKKMEIECTISYDKKNKKDVERKFFHGEIYRYPIRLCDILVKSLDNPENSHDNITIICDFHIVDEPVTSAPKNTFPRVAKRNLPIDIGELFINKKFTDMTFILGDKKIQAHKTILMARSPVFEAMFSHTMKEQNANEVQIDDIDYEVFEEMLRYIYTDDMSNLKCPLKQLYAADKYGLEDLKEMCGVLLYKGITVDNAAETFIFADRHNLTQLSELIRRFIRGHIDKFLSSPGYEDMVKKYPKFAINVFKLPTPEA